MHSRHIVAVIALTIAGLSLHPSAAAEEEVAHLQHLSEGLPYEVSNHCSYSPDCTFVVYTKQEIDTQHAADAKQIKDLRDLVAELQKNMKVLSDANDALTKRLEDAEKRLAAKH